MGILENLPAEMLCMIAGFLNPIDHTCLALTCQQVNNTIGVPEPDLEVERLAFGVRMRNKRGKTRLDERIAIQEELRPIIKYLAHLWIEQRYIKHIQDPKYGLTGNLERVWEAPDFPQHISRDFIVNFHVPDEISHFRMGNNHRTFVAMLSSYRASKFHKLNEQYSKPEQPHPWMSLAEYYIEVLAEWLGKNWEKRAETIRRTLVGRGNGEEFWEDFENLLCASEPNLDNPFGTPNDPIAQAVAPHGWYPPGWRGCMYRVRGPPTRTSPRRHH